MKTKDYIIMVILSLFLGSLIVHSQPTYKNKIFQDTPKITTQNVNGKHALFIGDSHTANFQNGWQTQLCKATGLKQENASQIGKTTYWMLNMAVYKLGKQFDYCFVYGGANDMYGDIAASEAVDNIRGIARICKKLGIKCVVLTGFDPVLCTRTPNKGYPYRYAEFQRMLMSQNMEGAIIVDTRVVDRRDCWDGLCHMNPEGHKKIAEKVIKDLAFQRI